MYSKLKFVFNLNISILVSDIKNNESGLLKVNEINGILMGIG